MSLNKFEYDDNIILLTFRGKSEWKTVTDSTKQVAGQLKQSYTIIPIHKKCSCIKTKS